MFSRISSSAAKSDLLVGGKDRPYSFETPEIARMLYSWL
jgi:hypothetical protein